MQAPSAKFGEPVPPARGDVRFGLRMDPSDPLSPDPYADEPKWPAWKVTVFVIVFCGAFWGGIGYLAMRLMG